MGGRITGSFIYAHPPDYTGRPTLDYSTKDWRGLLQELKELGIDTVIYQAVAWDWGNVKQCYYRSKIFEVYQNWDALDPLIEAVEAEEMTLYLGGQGSDAGYLEDAGIEENDQMLCFRELLAAYPGGFHGFYMSPETLFPGQREPGLEKSLNRYYTRACQEIKNMAPDLPILASPATYYLEGKDQEIHYLYNVFKGCPLDILAPQDSVGTFRNRLPYLEPAFKIWKQISQEFGYKLWVNSESFERSTIGTVNDFIPADIKRLRVQLVNADKFGEKIISWEVPYFFSSAAGSRGDKLRSDYLSCLNTKY